MSHKKVPRVDPRVHHHVGHAVHEELQAIISLLRFMWPLVLLFFVGLAVLLYVERPLPPSHLRIATGQPNSSLEALGKQYADYFQKNNIALELVSSAGALENMELLKQGKVDAAFTLGGMTAGIDFPNLRTLGSVEYQPFWLFYRGELNRDPNPTEFFKSHTFSINITGSGTRYMAEKILGLHGIDVNKNAKLISMSSPDSVEALLSGKIDGVFLTAGVESKTIQNILSNPNINIFDFPVADAYTKRLKFLDVINLPHGAFDLIKVIPPTDIKMVANTTNILVNKNLHPSIQYLFLKTTHKLDHASKTFFNRPGGFPANTISDVPLSDIADRFYTKGMPALHGYVPFWVSSFFDQIWLLLFAAFAIGYPLMKLVPNQRKLYASLCITDCYEALTEIDHRLMNLVNAEDLKKIKEDFLALEHEVNHLWIPSNFHSDFYTLKNSIEIVRSRLMRIQKHLADSPPAPKSETPH